MIFSIVCVYSAVCGDMYALLCTTSSSIPSEETLRVATCTRDSKLEHLFEKFKRVLWVSDGMSNGSGVRKDFVVVTTLKQASCVNPPRTYTHKRKEIHTGCVLSPKKWISSKPSSSTCLSAYVLSHPLGKMSKEICPPMENVSP